MRNIQRRKLGRWVAGLAFGVGALGAGLTPAMAQAWPSKPITIVVAYPAGGDTDAVARLLGEKLSSRLGQPVIVDNKPGASGIIGTSFVNKAPPDGYTLLMAPSTVTMAQLVLKPSPATAYDMRALTPIFQVGAQPLFLAAGPGGKFNTLADAVQASKTAALSYASPGTGSPMHVLGEMFNRAAGAQFSHVPYKGIAPGLNDVVGGHLPLTWVTYGPVEPYLKDGRIRLLAVAQDQRSPLAPNVPTLAEQGVALDSNSWQGLLAPAGTPDAIVQRLNAEVTKALAAPNVVEVFAKSGVVSQAGSVAQFSGFVNSEIGKYGDIIRRANISMG